MLRDSMVEREQASSRLSRAAEGALWLLLFFCPLALGGAPVWTLLPSAALACAALLLWSLRSHRERSAVGVPTLAFALLAAAAFCAVQLIPLPAALLRLLSAQAAETRAFTTVPLGLTSNWPLSFDPSATWRELSKHLSYLAVMLVAAGVSRSRRARGRLLGAVALSGTFVATIGFAHLLVDAKTLFGLHAFRFSAPPLVTPFANPNHLAGFLLLSGTVAFGLALRVERTAHRLLWTLAFIACGLGVFLSLSRGGIIFFVAAQLVLAALHLRQRWAKRAEVPPAETFGAGAWAAAAVVAVLSVGAYVAYDRISTEFVDSAVAERAGGSKLDTWPDIASAATRFSIAGMGRGAFEHGFSRFQVRSPGATVTHPENILLQLWSELGTLPALLLLGTVGVGLLRLRRRELSSPADLAALVAVSALALHNLFDFNLEFTPCAVAACALVGVLFREDAPTRLSSWQVPAHAAPGAAACLCVVALAALIPGHHTAASAEDQLAQLLEKGAKPSEVRQAALPLIDQHPADYLLYELVATAYSSRLSPDPGEALAFINRALYLRPLGADAHRVAARALGRLRKRSQACLEYRLAYEVGIDQSRTLAEAARFAKGVEELTRIIPKSIRPAMDLGNLLWDSGRPAEAHGVLAWVLEDGANTPDAADAWALAGTFQVNEGAFEKGLGFARKAGELNPRLIRAPLVAAWALAGMGQRDRAIALLEEALAKQPGSVELALGLAEQALTHGDPRRAREVVTRANAFATSSNDRSRLLHLEGLTFEREERPSRALQAFQLASRLTPGHPYLHYATARVLDSLHRPAEAAVQVREGMKFDHGPRLQTMRAELARLEALEAKPPELERPRAPTVVDSPSEP